MIGWFIVRVSPQEWPVHGGEWGSANCNYPEIIVTGFVCLSLPLSLYLPLSILLSV